MAWKKVQLRYLWGLVLSLKAGILIGQMLLTSLISVERTQKICRAVRRAWCTNRDITKPASAV